MCCWHEDGVDDDDDDDDGDDDDDDGDDDGDADDDDDDDVAQKIPRITRVPTSGQWPVHSPAVMFSLCVWHFFLLRGIRK